MSIRIAGIESESIVDGPGFRFAVYTQGCPHACPECEKAHLPLTDVGGGHLCRCNRLDAIAAEAKRKEARA